MATTLHTPTPAGRFLAQAARAVGVFAATAVNVLFLGKHGVD